ncbi:MULTISPECIES: autotransporter outer membrane beta-barrel domain-containing protein [Pseudomonas]|uniref:Autotransporter outer membrane beta-barrel domain-containing protein n=1 Tax=Pseudomonas juntendi TaxID=2666183 RepID=A0A7W2KED1_9PSED|nr:MULTISPECIES: autotransporter outer membrane beta-barrel domain-containing protein [Pseudomonas]MBA6097005.1 autotransporter outer membrane beta-barrel domain-containing protein [Pseudomonas juntendi]
MIKASHGLGWGRRIVIGIATAPFSLFGALSNAATVIVDKDTTIDGSAPIDSYQVLGGATLTGNGAILQGVHLRGGGALVLNGSTVDGDGDAVLLEGGAQATLDGSVVTNRGRGLVLARDSQGGSVARVTGSTISGAQGGASVASGSQLYLINSTVQGSTAGSYGVRLFNGLLQAQSSQIVGAQEGILVGVDNNNPGQAQIDLDSSQVVGQDGAAIVVAGSRSGSASAVIHVANGSTLSGSNGNLLEVRNDSTADLTVDNAHLVGNVVVEEGSSAVVTLDNQASLTGQLENVATLTIANQARWTLVDDASVGELRLDGGTVQFGAPTAYHRLTLESLSGQGTFVMDADFSTGSTDFLDVTGNASGSHSLLIGSSGAEPDNENELHVVHTGGGDAQFALLDGPVDLGAFSYELVQRGDDWYLDGSRKVISPGTQSVMALFNAAPTVWYGELSSLRSRMGELRLDDGKAGGWLRSYGNKYDVAASSGVAYRQIQRGISLGVDAPLPVGDGQWLLGVLAGHSRSDLDLTGGTTGEVESYYLGLYTTWLDRQSGYYFDGVVKLNRFDNESKVALSDGSRAKGDYANHGVGMSAEFGRHIELDDGYFVEPFTQWSTAYFQTKDYHLDNGLKADGERAWSLLGKAGASAGRNYTFSDGRVLQPYLRAAYAHEFANNNAVKVNGHHFSNDLSGSRLELGAGLAVSLADKLQVHADIEHSRGEGINQPWGATIGLRYSW